MTVYRPDGSKYFSTDAVRPFDEVNEENYWTAQGYLVEFEEAV